MRTPWGTADHVTVLPNGIKSVSTPSHGGYFVPKKLLVRIPAAQQAYAITWSGSPQWYEEDCAWAIVALNFPELFNAEDVAAAQQTFDGWIAPKLTEVV